MQGKVAHFMHHKVVLCIVVCNHMLFTCHKIINMPKFQLDYDY
jgi:hypothetical protein